MNTNKLYYPIKKCGVCKNPMQLRVTINKRMYHFVPDYYYVINIKDCTDSCEIRDTLANEIAKENTVIMNMDHRKGILNDDGFSLSSNPEPYVSISDVAIQKEIRFDFVCSSCYLEIKTKLNND